jgi:putative endonuclease
MVSFSEHSKPKYPTKKMFNPFYIYILTNYWNNVIYTGFTDDLRRRTEEHKNKVYPKSFTAAYNVNKLVYYEEFALAADAVAREQQLKAGGRQRKIDLVNEFNPEWIDLYYELFGDE